MPLASPAFEASTEASKVTVSGATMTTMPAPITSRAGRTSWTYDAPGPTRSIISMPAPHTSGPTVSGIRGPSRRASIPEWDENSSISTVLGNMAAPAASAEYPTTICSCRAVRKKNPPVPA